MTQEHKELLIKDLCARLPYGVKVLCLKDFNHKWYNLEMIDIGDNEIYLTADEPYTNRYAEIEDIKPYLFPISSMTEEQKNEFKLLFDLNYASAYCQEIQIAANMIKWLNKNHFDIYGLIPMDLAIDATGLNIY